MKILYLNNEMTVGGVTKCILKLCKELYKKDIDIVVASHGGALLKEFKDMNIKYYPILDVQNKNPINIMYNVKKIIDIVKKENIQIIHSHHRMTTLLSKIVSKFTDVRVIHTQHLCIEDKFKLTKLALKNIDVITVSEAAKRILENKSNLNGNRITTIYNAIETENNNKVVDERLIELSNKGYFIVAQVSRVIDYKGIYDFVDVAELTVKTNRNIRFVFIGDGPEKESLEKYIIKKNLQDYILMLGSKDNVIEHLKYINLLILCSYIEGLPLVPLEAFSQGIPVIATNIDGTNEEIQEGDNGYLVKVKDVQTFMEKINLLYEEKNIYCSMKKNAIKLYNDKFSTCEYISKHNDIYQIHND